MRRKAFLLLTVVSLILFSCGGNNNSSQNENETTENETKSEEKIDSEKKNKNIVSDKFSELTFNANDIPNDLYLGELQFGKKWQDKNGTNVVVFTSAETFEQWKDGEEGMGDFTINLKAYHFTSKDDKKWNEVRLVQDWNQEPCGSPPFALEVDFIKDQVSVTDINNDGYGEICFVYHMQCASELSTKTMKLMLLENGSKYPIRGQSYADYGFQIIGGDTNWGDEFTNAPSGFKDYAEEKWLEAQYFLSYLEDERIKFVEFWQDFKNAAATNSKTDIAKISKCDYFETFAKFIQDKLKITEIDKVSFNDDKAELILDIEGSTIFFQFGKISGNWYLINFNAAG